MNDQEVRIVQYSDLPQGGFAGIVEKLSVLNANVWPQHKNRSDVSWGLGGLLRLASGHFKPNDGAPLHPHNDVDIVTVIFDGRVAHSGTLGDGTVIDGPGVQVQRAGSGMTHSEFSITDSEVDFVQIWFLPPDNGMSPNYKNFEIPGNGMVTVLGGKDGSFDNDMTCQVGYLNAGERLESDKPFVAFIAGGEAFVNGETVTRRDLIEGPSINLEASSRVGLILISSTI